MRNRCPDFCWVVSGTSRFLDFRIGSCTTSLPQWLLVREENSPIIPAGRHAPDECHSSNRATSLALAGERKPFGLSSQYFGLLLVRTLPTGVVFVSVVLGRNGTLREEPARLQVLTVRPLGRWACQIVEPETSAQQSGVRLMLNAVLLYIRL